MNVSEAVGRWVAGEEAGDSRRPRCYGLQPIVM